MGLLDQIVSGVTRSVLTELEARALPAVLSRVLASTDLGSIGGLLQQLQQSGLDRQVGSWLGNGSNLPISPDQLRNALGDDRIREIAGATGLPIDDLLKTLSQKLPEAIDHISPNGQLEEPSEAGDDSGAGQGGSLAGQAGLDDVGRN